MGNDNKSNLEQIKERFFINNYQFNALLESIPQIIYMSDVKGKFVIGTKNAKDFVLEGIDNLHNLKLNFSRTEDKTIYNDRYVLENNKSISYDTEFYDLKGIPHWYHIYKSPVHDYNNTIIGIIITANNINEEKLLQAQRETFVASLGHDLKNPTLAQIRATELLLKGTFGTITEEQKDILTMLLDSCKYMNAMLSSLLATYRNEKGIVTLNYENIALTLLTDECVSEMIYLAKDKGISLKIKNLCSNPYIYADKVQIKRVIMNLLSNGIKYSYKNSTINIQLYNEAEYTCFSIETKSPFIQPDNREAIFAQYISFAEAYQELGIGLGLYASKKIVNAHGGTIFAESYKDNRNIFYFKIPNIKDCVCASKTVTF